MISERLKQARKASGLSLRALAERSSAGGADDPVLKEARVAGSRRELKKASLASQRSLTTPSGTTKRLRTRCPQLIEHRCHDLAQMGDPPAAHTHRDARTDFGSSRRTGCAPSKAFSRSRNSSASRTAEDCAMVFNVLHGVDPKDASTVTTPMMPQQTAVTSQGR